jgi:hypothetical protein
MQVGTEAAKGMPMAIRNLLPESLAKRINISKAEPSLLRQLCELPPDESDIKKYINSERFRHLKALDAHFGLDANAPNLSEHRGKAIVAYVYGVPADSPDWWSRFSGALMVRHIPGFSFGRRGHPLIWTFNVLLALGKDIRALKARYPDLKGDDFYRALQIRHPKTWGQFGIPALRKAYAKEQALGRNYKSAVLPGQPISAARSAVRQRTKRDRR